MDIIANIRRTNPALIEQQQSLFFFLVFPWLADYDQLSLPQRNLLERRKIQVAELKFGGERTKEITWFSLEVSGDRLRAGFEVWQDAAGFGFLPCVEDAVDYGDGGDDGDDPEHRGHAVEEATDDQQHEAFGALHEADFT